MHVLCSDNTAIKNKNLMDNKTIFTSLILFQIIQPHKHMKLNQSRPFKMNEQYSHSFKMFFIKI